MRILFVSRWFPYPPDNGSKLRVYNLLRGLAQRHEVHLLSFVGDLAEADNSPRLSSMCCEVQTVHRKSFRPESWRAITGYFASVPRSVLDTFSPEMARLIRRTLSQKRFDLVIASQEGAAAYVEYFNGVPALFEEVEVAVLYERFARARSVPRRFRDGLTWIKQKRYLSGLLQQFRACTVVSDTERRLLSEVLDGVPPLEVIPNCVNLKDYTGVEETPRVNQLIFTGSFRYEPNYEAMVWFLREVFAKIQDQVPGVQLVITGDHADRPIPESTGVQLTGRVDDVRPLVASSAVSLAPVLTGGGTRLKILEAMALRTPVVATSKGAEGLDVVSGRDLLIADTPAEFAEQTVKLLRDSGLRRSLTENSFQLISSRYNWPAVMPLFLKLIEQVVYGRET